MNLYLKARHWQMFILLFGGMFFAQFIVTNLSMGIWSLIVPATVFGVIYFGWLWTIAYASSKKLPPELASSPKLMGIGLLYALLYFVFGGYLFFGGNTQMPGYAMVLHLLAMAAIFYALGFTAKQLIKLQTNKEVSFFNYSGPFFLFWFFPIGVWFIQPKVNKLLAENNNA